MEGLRLFITILSLLFNSNFDIISFFIKKVVFERMMKMEVRLEEIKGLWVFGKFGGESLFVY